MVSPLNHSNHYGLQSYKTCKNLKKLFNVIILIQYNKRNDVSYANADLFEIFDERLDDLNLFQLIKFNTDAELRES